MTLNYAVYSKEGKLNLYLPRKKEDIPHTKYNTVMLDRAHGETQFLEVQAHSLDYLLQLNMIKHEDVKWIKIDVEGAELEVLKGAHKILYEAKDITLIIEIHNSDLYKNIVKFLDIYNFKIEFEKGGGEWRHIITRKYNHFKR